MTKRNHIRTRGLLPWRAHYFYLDRRPWLADRVFVRNRLTVNFTDEFEHEDSRYTVVTCWVYSWHAEEFERCMTELVRDSLLDGRTDYLDACEKLSWLFEADAHA